MGVFMSKDKLTLYVDEEMNKLAHQTAKLSGKSISMLLREYLISKRKEISSKEISSKVSKWIGLLETHKSYKQLRDEHMSDKLKTYENLR